MVWHYVDQQDTATIRNSVDLAVTNSVRHGDSLGRNEVDKRITVKNIVQRMDSDDLTILTDPSFDAGIGAASVSVFFHKMRWLSLFGVRSDGTTPFGEVWVVTVVFAHSILPQTGGDRQYQQFASQLADVNVGPLVQFMRDRGNLSSLYVVGPVNAGVPTAGKRIGRLEIATRDLLAQANGHWSMLQPVTITRAYMGTDPDNQTQVPIDSHIFDIWGSPSVTDNFDLSELVYTP